MLFFDCPRLYNLFENNAFSVAFRGRFFRMQNMDYLQDENVKEIIELIKTIKQPRKLRRELENYHDND